MQGCRNSLETTAFETALRKDRAQLSTAVVVLAGENLAFPLVSTTGPSTSLFTSDTGGHAKVKGAAGSKE